MEKASQVDALLPTHLAIIWLLRFHQIAVEPERLMHEVCGASNPMALLRFIRKSGLKAKALRVPADRLARIPMPAVALLCNGNAVVIGRVGKDDVLFVDPATLLPKLRPLEEFLREWTGIMILATRRDSAAGLGQRFNQTRLSWRVGSTCSVPSRNSPTPRATQIEHGGEARANLASLTRQFQAQQADYANAVQQDLADAEQKLSENEAQYRAAAHEADDMVLRAPVTGTVQQVSVHSEHGVVTPAERLMVVVPDARTLVVEAMVANRDIGFVHAGQAVKVKVAAFDFTRYGLIPGHVVSLSRDAADDTARDTQDQAPGAGNGSPQHAAGSEPDLDGGQGGGYVARIALDRDTVAIEHRRATLEPGMSVTAEILTGKRRIIAYLLSPMMRYAHDAGGER